ncbi:hypothetical protein E4T42_00933 [Aureobasidium subglaciale]|nr:hypothetical protein E4T42_00933 [Aureobasidium subglaciale]
MANTANTPFRRWARANFTTSFLYPLMGVLFFLKHRYMWPLLKAKMLPLVVLSVFILIILFLTAYLPQVALLKLFHKGGSAWVNGTFLVLTEGNLIIALLFEAFLVDHTQVDVFDAVMVARGHAELVKAKRPVDTEEPETPLKALGPRDKGAVFAPFNFRQLFEFVVLLPLNFIPFVGVPLFLILTGYRAGPLLQRRYHNLKGMTSDQRKIFIRAKSMRYQYMWFGTVALLLQLVPVLSMFFLITTAAGSALWAADMEDLKRSQENAIEDEYTDEP